MMYRFGVLVSLAAVFVSSAAAGELALSRDRGTLVSLSVIVAPIGSDQVRLVQYDAEQLRDMGQVSLRDGDYGPNVEIEKVFFNVMYPDHYVKSPVHSRDWVERVDALIWDPMLMTPDMVLSLGDNPDWEENFGMVVLEGRELYHTICLRAGHGGDDQSY